jgi:kynurenine formamidase
MTGRGVYDVSLTIQPGMPVWPGSLPVAVDVVKSIPPGDCKLLCLLLKLKSGDSAPALVLLRGVGE